MSLYSWQFWALASAAFAAQTAIFAKVGIEGINSDYATFIRTLVIAAVTRTMPILKGRFVNQAEPPRRSMGKVAINDTQGSQYVDAPSS